ncbi:phage tail protein [Rhizobium sp. FKY42]|uniref:phage tail protein n=1 Tax=Rhizobium sp. FKY42 TaxID=2562310 RepID=UPI0010C0EFC9|nr:phage tail protein [Rhizobium sp. FKY42]
MQYILGAVVLDTRPLPADSVRRSASGGLVAKPVIGGLQRKERTGIGEDDIIISGTALPSRIGGLPQLEVLHAMRRAGTRFPLMRGDGTRPGWYAIKQIDEEHREVQRNGVGFEIAYTITLEQAEEQQGDALNVIGGLFSLFKALGGL